MLYDHERLVSQKEQSRRAAREYALLNAAREQNDSRKHVHRKSRRNRLGVRTVLARALS
ncbi:MAG: hypothetical protein ACTH2Q_06745 [Propionibacteriaceae bacterium]